MTRTGIRPEHHQGVVFNELELPDFAFWEGEGGNGGVSGRADTVDRV